MITGALSTLLIPETKQRTLEELSNEDQEGFVQGESLLPRSPARALSLTRAVSPGPAAIVSA